MSPEKKKRGLSAFLSPEQEKKKNRGMGAFVGSEEALPAKKTEAAMRFINIGEWAVLLKALECN